MKYYIKTQKHSKKTLKRPLLKTAATVLSALFITAMLISCTGCSRKENGAKPQNSLFPFMSSGMNEITVYKGNVTFSLFCEKGKSYSTPLYI